MFQKKKRPEPPQVTPNQWIGYSARAPKPEAVKEYTMEEVAKHNKQDDCWLVIGNFNNGGPKVYDVTKFLNYHPGGAKVMLDFGGQDADNFFEDIGHSNYAREELKEHQIGVLKVPEERCPLQTTSLFFVKLMEPDDHNVNLKLSELVSLIDDVHQLKIFYTIVASCLRLGAVSDSDAASYVKRGLNESSGLCSSEKAIFMFKLILEKANEDGHIPRADFHLYNNRAELTRIENAPFVLSMRNAIRANTARIKGLKANVEAVNASINSIKEGLRRKQKVEATVGFIGAIVNAVTLGVGGNLLVAAEKTLGSIVDFGDIAHLKKVVMDTGDSELIEQFQLGVEIGSGRIADNRLKKAIKEDNVLVVLSAAAVMAQQSPGEEMQEDLNACMGLESDAGDKNEVENKVDDTTEMFSDAILDEEEEDDLPVHAAVKYGNQECLEEALDEKGVDVNRVDSVGRTAMDLAALMGQLELLKILKENGGKFRFKNPPRMKCIAKKREPHAEKYLELINEQA